MNKLMIRFATISCLGFVFVGSGCQPATNTRTQSTDHGHNHDHFGTPKSLPAAIEELEEMWKQIRTAMDKDDPKSAHEPLHQVGPLIKAMPDLAADTDLSESEWKNIKKLADQLVEAFGDIDSAFHKKDGDKQAAYDKAKSIIDKGIEELETKLPLLGATATMSAHKHDHHHSESHIDHE